MALCLDAPSENVDERNKENEVASVNSNQRRFIINLAHINKRHLNRNAGDAIFDLPCYWLLVWRAIYRIRHV